MDKLASRLVTLSFLSMALIAAPIITKAHAAGSDTPSPPASDSTKDKKKHDKNSSIQSARLLLSQAR